MVYRVQVFCQHANQLLRILIVSLADVRLVVHDVGFEVVQQTDRHLREVDDVVHRVLDAVDESLCQFTHTSHLLLTYQLILGVAQVVEGFLQAL